MPWYLIETFCPEPSASIVFTDGHEREWASLRTVQRSDGVTGISDLVAQVRRSGDELDRIVAGRMGPRRVVMRPVLGFEGDVYGIRTWIGPPDEPIATERAIASVNWDVDSLVARHTLESYMMSSITPDGFGDTRDPGQFLRKVVQFDALNELAELCMNDGSRTHFQGRLTVLHDDSHLMAWRGVARSNAGPEGTEVRGMFHDVTDTEEPQIAPLAALKLGQLDDGPATVLVAYRTSPTDPSDVVPVLMYWVSPRPRYVAESAVEHSHSSIPGNLVNPSDFGTFLRAREALMAGDDAMEIPIDVKLLGVDGEWVPVRLNLRRYPGAVGSLMHVARFERVGEG
ncbi:MAG: DUF5593 domain-containing protein [Actinomycetota bacterium]|nr:DUF5593 domain-containing protein [Actinomycetota bacterium]